MAGIYKSYKQMKTIKILEVAPGWALGLLLVLGVACVPDGEYRTPELDCWSGEEVNTSFADVRALYKGETINIQEDRVIDGVVISSDEAGNFFGSLHFQDKPEAGGPGFQLEIDLHDAHLLYPAGSHIILNLKGLYLGVSNDSYKLGGVFSAFGQKSVGRLPAAAVADHLFSGCALKVALKPTPVQLQDLGDSLLNTLVQIVDVEIAEASRGLPFAPRGEEGVRFLQDCSGNTVELLNSGYSDFYAETLPDGRGTITGVLLKDGSHYQLQVRNLSDIDFSGTPCGSDAGGWASDQVLISELADPDNEADARFVELFNAGKEALALSGWRLLRYTNSNTEVSSSLDLSGWQIEANGTLVIAADAGVFEGVYGFAPDLEGGTNGPADSNGDDNLVLVDPFGEVVDVFGIVGEDGSGTNHEFEDGRAVRKASVTTGNPQFDFNEWDIYNDSGFSGTVLAPQNAPQDFSPGIR